MATLRNDPEYVRRRDALRYRTRRQGDPCWLCGGAFDWSLPYTHPAAFTADHVLPVGLGGNMCGPLRPAHRSCNSRRGTRSPDTIVNVSERVHSRRW